MVTRSSSGSSHGSGSGSGSSGYQSVREERELIRDKCHVELDSDEEVTEPVSQVVTVTGGLQLGGAGAITSKVRRVPLNIDSQHRSIIFFRVVCVLLEVK